jgi:PAS domain S-box-containing protein
MSRAKITPTGVETTMKENDFIVSKTDPKGIITYVNRIFMKMSGYDEIELIYTNHNIIRHPDMPRIAFKVAWELIQSGDEFFGFVKNLRKDGGYYWVYTNIMPDFDTNNNIIGYTSVRRKPNPKALETIIPLYKSLLDAEQSGGMDASGKLLQNFLKEHKISYDELVINLQKGAKL